MTSTTPNPWEPSIVAFEEQDRKTPPPKDPIVFTGSSTFTYWAPSLAADFAPLPVLGRGFGGSQMSDVLQYVDRLILAYRPQAVVIYSGDNDIASGRSPEQVCADFAGIVKQTRAAQPHVRFYLCPIKPSPSRWSLWPQMDKANGLMRQVVAKLSAARYVDMVPPMLTSAGQPRPELFLEDMLHMNPQGYAVWSAMLKPILEADLLPAGG